jgi:hypothetical protein
MRRSIGLLGLALLVAACNAKPVETPTSAETVEKAATTAETGEKAKTAEAPKEAKAEEPAAVPEAAQPTAKRIENVGFQTPESVYFDARSGGYLVSNINGSPLEKDDNGFISVLLPSGTVHELKWIDGASKDFELHAPKGMGIAHNRLYVADLDVVRMFDAKSAEYLGKIPIEGATFLNDIAVGPDGTVYVSDSGLTTEFKASGTDAIYAISKANTVTTLIKDASLGRPNGILVAGNGILVVTFGTGEMFSIGPKGVKSEPRRIGEGQLDGVVRINEREVLVSSWASKAIFRGRPGGRFTPVIEGLRAPADIGYDSKRNRVLIPLFQDNAVLIHQL